MFGQIVEFVKDEQGATAVEYGLIAALMSMAGMAAFSGIGGTLESFFDFVRTEINDAVN